ncbi:MAG TPA: ATP-binding protein [Ramlibacter sp.]
MKLRTLRARLLRTLTIALVIVFLALWLLLVVGIRRVSERQMVMHLDHDADAVMVAMQFDGPDTPRLDTHGIEPVYEERASGHYYEVRLGGRDFARSPSLAGQGLAAETPAAGTRADYRADGPAGQRLIVLAKSELRGGSTVTVYVAEEIGDVTKDIERLSALAFGLFVLVLPGALVLQGLAVRKALAPLDALQLELREVGAGRHTRIEGEVPLEIKPLVDELNRLLALLQRRLNQSRTAVGNLAHALKTPLAVLFRTAEDPALPGPARAGLEEQANIIRERVERELRRARVAGPAAGGAGAMFRPRTELDLLVRVLRRVYSARVLSIEVDAGDELLPLDREDMLELVGNLADNACKWAHSRVAIRVRPTREELRIAVADDGPGCSEADAGAILQRGVRLDEAAPGHGLGLAIVKDIAEFYRGSLAITRDPQLGGMRVEVALPMPATSAPAGG